MIKLTMTNEEISEQAESMVTFMKTLLQINSGEYVVTTTVIKDCDSNDDPEEGNLSPNLDGELSINDEDGTLSSMASGVLVGSNGKPNWATIRIIKEGGFDVFSTESDSFGWLGGAVRTRKGLIFFG